MPTCQNVFRHKGLVCRQDREHLHGHRGYTVWFTGLSASGKSTIAHQAEQLLHQRGCSTYVLDGDNVRHGLCRDLGFSREDRSENLRRIGEMVKLFVDAGIIVLTAFISPYRADRHAIKSMVGRENLLEVYVTCPVEVCSLRDPKGLYSRAKEGKIKNFTGVTAPYEEPENPDLVLNSTQCSPLDAAQLVVGELERLQVVPKESL